MSKEISVKKDTYGCPKCNSDNVEVTDSYLEDEYFCYVNHCNDCDTTYKDWYRLEYEETVYYEDT